MAIDIEKLTIKTAREKLLSGEISSVDLAEASLENIKKKDADVHAYLEVFDDVLEQAKRADELYAKKESKSLTGIPLAIKDNILIKGKTASAASKILENYKATYDATVIKKLKKEGAVFVGRTNMDEFAMGSSTENSAFGVTKNPHDTKRVSGGSSGGSAAAVAMGGVLGALGSDTGGSIRQPAAFCGTVGFKPTYGTVSRHGLMAMASSLDQIGPFARTVEDAEIIFSAIKGHDTMDSTSRPDEDVKDEVRKTLTIGIPKDFLEIEGLDKDILNRFNEKISELEKQGYKIKEVSLPRVKHSLATYYIIMPAEVSSNLARFDGVRYGTRIVGDTLLEDYSKSRGEGFGSETRRRILLGTYMLSSGYYDAYYNKANIVREYIKEDFRKAFKDVDIVATPTTPSPAFNIGEKGGDPLKMYLEDIFTVPANLTGLPAISIPMGTVDRSGNAMPIGIQFVAPEMSENILFSIGKNVESL